MSETTEALPTAVAPRTDATWLARPSIREAAWGIVFIGPWLIGLVLFTAGPMIVSLVMSLTNFDLVHPSAARFVGLDNYVRMASDPNVIKRAGRKICLNAQGRVVFVDGLTNCP